MSQVFNSGKSGYTCDKCRKLITIPLILVSRGGNSCHYCSEKCMKEHYNMQGKLLKEKEKKSEPLTIKDVKPKRFQKPYWKRKKWKKKK